MFHSHRCENFISKTLSSVILKQVVYIITIVPSGIKTNSCNCIMTVQSITWRTYVHPNKKERYYLESFQASKTFRLFRLQGLKMFHILLDAPDISGAY
jgi:hypothetical protein